MQNQANFSAFQHNGEAISESAVTDGKNSGTSQLNCSMFLQKTEKYWSQFKTEVVKYQQYDSFTFIFTQYW